MLKEKRKKGKLKKEKEEVGKKKMQWNLKTPVVHWHLWWPSAASLQHSASQHLMKRGERERGRKRKVAVFNTLAPIYLTPLLSLIPVSCSQICSIWGPHFPVCWNFLIICSPDWASHPSVSPTALVVFGGRFKIAAPGTTYLEKTIVYSTHLLSSSGVM